MKHFFIHHQTAPRFMHFLLYQVIFFLGFLFFLGCDNNSICNSTDRDDVGSGHKDATHIIDSTTTSYDSFLDRYLTDNDLRKNFFTYFQSVGMLGGSLASGSVCTDDSTSKSQKTLCSKDYTYAINQIWANKYNFKTINFSYYGLSTKQWLTDSVHGLAKAQILENRCQIYFILFGGNDIKAYNGLTNLGSIQDIYMQEEDSNKHTYYGNYSRILANLKKIGGEHTKIFALTYNKQFNSNELIINYNKATKEIVELYDDVFLIDLEEDEIIMDENISKEIINKHYTPKGYSLIANRVETLVNELIQKNITSFQDILEDYSR